ncbi:hypothetical protein LAV73_09310 [Lysinibacillus xylanilyticus]|uniref:hypothetical protein n=1 Tax=Lysinibacillus xylanilyticus TaxID=582475 RepID=UPI002B24D89E|nr:hypothetical protein [Lysinibacillus xylanilyticus]MEB2280191.1 hypothetical protein [Lysinibacillus xylanilyticus]
MKTKIVKERSTKVRSTSIEFYRSSKEKRTKKVQKELPAEIKKHDIGWGTVFEVVIAILSLINFFASLMWLVLIFGFKF